MALPSVTINRNEGSAAPLGSGASKALVIGPASSGVKETKIYTFGNTADVAGSIGYGPAQELAELMIAQAPPGFKTIDVLVSSGSIASEIVTESALANVTASGTPNSTYDIRLEIRKTGKVQGNSDVGTFRYSLDGGNTYSADIQLPVSGATGAKHTLTNSGVTLEFEASSTFTDGNTARFVTVAPLMNTTDLTNCFTTLSKSNTNYTVVAVAQDTPNAVSCSALFSTVDSELTDLSNDYKFTAAVLPVGGETFKFNRDQSEQKGDQDTTTVLANITGSAASTGNFISAVAERANTTVVTPYAGYGKPRKPFAYMYAAMNHAVGNDISKNIAEEAIARVETPSYDDRLDGTVYNDLKVVAPRSFQGEPGVFINNSYLKSATASTYNIFPKARITNRASTVAKQKIRPWLHKRVRTLTDGTGRIDPRDKAKIEKDVRKALRAALLSPTNGQGFAGHVTDFSYTINPENNLLLTGQLESTLLIVPFAYPTQAVVEIFLTDELETA